MAATLQVSISLNKVELSVGESKFFICTGTHATHPPTHARTHTRVHNKSHARVCLEVGHRCKTSTCGVGLFSWWWQVWPCPPYGECQVDPEGRSRSSSAMSSQKGMSTLHSRAPMPVTQQGGRILWQGQPPPPAACVFSPASPLSVELTVRGVPTRWEEGWGAMEVLRGWKKEKRWMDSKHGRDWKGEGLPCKNRQTDRCGKNGKGFQVKELWRWEIRSLQKPKSGDDPAAFYVMLLWLKNRLYSGNSFLFVSKIRKCNIQMMVFIVLTCLLPLAPNC